MRHSLGEKVSLVLSSIPSTILVAKDLKLKGFVQDYLPLHIDSVLPDRPLSFDLFIFFKETYLCYTPKGQPLTSDKLTKLKNQTIARFFVNKVDIDNVYLTMDQGLKEVVVNKMIPVDDKISFTKGAAKTAVENYNAAIEAAPDNAMVYYEYAMYAYESGLTYYEKQPHPAMGDKSFLKAEEMFQKALDQCSDYHANCSYYLGVINYSQKDMENAVKWFNQFKSFKHNDNSRYPDDFDKSHFARPCFFCATTLG